MSAGDDIRAAARAAGLDKLTDAQLAEFAASRAAARGYAVCVNYLHRREAAERVVADIRAAGGRAEAVQADVAADADVAELAGV